MSGLVWKTVGVSLFNVQKSRSLCWMSRSRAGPCLAPKHSNRENLSSFWHVSAGLKAVVVAPEQIWKSANLQIAEDLFCSEIRWVGAVSLVLLASKPAGSICLRHLTLCYWDDSSQMHHLNTAYDHFQKTNNCVSWTIRSGIFVVKLFHLWLWPLTDRW